MKYFIVIDDLFSTNVHKFDVLSVYICMVFNHTFNIGNHHPIHST